MKGYALGPEDIRADEAATLRTLSRYEQWRRASGHGLLEFGIFGLHRDLARLTGEIHDSLDDVHAGFFGGTWVEWSRWKWVRNAVVQTRRLDAATRQRVLDEISETLVASAAQGERDGLAARIAHEMRATSNDGI
jgi:hypothetical protein